MQRRQPENFLWRKDILKVSKERRPPKDLLKRKGLPKVYYKEITFRRWPPAGRPWKKDFQLCSPPSVLLSRGPSEVHL